MVLTALSQTPWQVWRGTPPFPSLYAPPNTKSCIRPCGTVQQQGGGNQQRGPIWLLICYVIKNVVQAVVAFITVVLSLDYEFDKSSILPINKTFLSRDRETSTTGRTWTRYNVSTVPSLSTMYSLHSTASCQSVCSLQPPLDQWRGGQGGPGGQLPPLRGLKNRGATEHKGRQQLTVCNN